MPTVADKETDTATQSSIERKSGQALTSSRGRMRESLRGVGYEKGSRALSPRGDGDQPEAPKPAATEEERREAQRQSYEALLGQFFGGKLFELVTKHTTPDGIMKYASKAVDALIKAAGDQVGKVEGLDDESRKAAGALVEVLGQILDEQAEAYLASQEGQDLAKKVSNHVAGHPGQVVAAVLLAAAAAVAANVSLPEIAAKTSLARGLDAEVKAKLGKVRDIALESISARVQFTSGRFKAEAGVTHEDGKTTGTVGASYGDEQGAVSTRATLDRDGLLSAQVGVRGQKGSASGSAGVAWKRDAGTSADATIEVGDQKDHLSAAAKYEFDKGLLNVRLSREVTEGFFSRSNSLVFEDGKASSEDAIRYVKDGKSLEVTRKTGPAGETNTSLATRYSARDLTVALNAAFGSAGNTVSASVKGHPKEGMTYKADATYSLSDSRLLNYGASFGFQDPKKFEGFLLEYRRNNAPQVPEDRFRATVEFTVQQMMFRVQDETVLKGGRLSSGTASAHAAYPLGKDLALIGGATYGYGPERTVGTMPQVGLQIRDIPVLVGYDTNSKTWTLRLTIPFGRK